VYRAAPLFALLVADLSEQFAARLALGQQDPAFFECLADRGEAVCGAVLVPAWVVGGGDCAVMRLGEGAAREDVCGGEAGRFLDAVEEEDLVGG
jgi:hypothetical protein